MTKGTRIIAIEAGTPKGGSVQETGGDASLPHNDAWTDSSAAEDAAPTLRRRWLPVMAGLLTVVAVAGWTTLFVRAHQAEILAGGSVQQWATWLADWSAPALLVAVCWLLAMRNSRREASRFGDVAQLLGREAATLETRLNAVNSELSLAREFIAAQSRDLESLGRVAVERLSQHAEQLSSLVADNSTRVETLGSVSAAALDNMEKLRGQLPVIASSAKDVTNTIAAAGHTANAQIEDLIAGFNRLNQFGQASERQVSALTDRIDAAIAEFTTQTTQLDSIAGARFAALAERGEAFRGELDAHEVAALACIRTRANALAAELVETRALLDQTEEQSLVSLRSRLSAVRDEGAAIGRSLRDTEAGALQTWQRATTRLVDDLRTAVGQIGDIDAQAIESAHNRLTELAREAEEVDLRLAERDRTFAEELERRRSDLAERHEQFGNTLQAQMDALDQAMAQRRAEQDERAQQMLAYTAEIAAQLDGFGETIRQAADHSGTAQSSLATSLDALAERLATSGEALAGTDRAVMELTDNSVRLLELIQASVSHASIDLPNAMSTGEARLAEIERRTAALSNVAGEAEARGASLLTHVELSDRLLDAMASKTERQAATLAEIQQCLAATSSESLALADHAQSELKSAIEALAASARDAVGQIESGSAEAVTAVAQQLAEQSDAAIDATVRARTGQVVEQLEAAIAKATGLGREAAIQLRDQLAKVDELAGNLERRVSQARNRAEEQVDNDFARRVAVITEALNSNAIDIARAMDADVSDKAWAAYLKGDRGVFTRRAARLLDPAEGKAVSRMYRDEPAFREHVSRYIHDFEAMLRQLLSTRDGHSLGVTLLSSDMGKLYVALAQSIERLRT